MKKTVFIITDHGLAIIYFLKSDVINKLLEKTDDFYRYEFKGEKDQATGNWNLKRNGVVLCSLYFGPNAIKIYSYLSGSEEPIGLMPHPDTKFCKTTPVFDKPNDSTLIVKISARTD